MTVVTDHLKQKEYAKQLTLQKLLATRPNIILTVFFTAGQLFLLVHYLQWLEQKLNKQLLTLAELLATV